MSVHAKCARSVALRVCLLTTAAACSLAPAALAQKASTELPEVNVVSPKPASSIAKKPVKAAKQQQPPAPPPTAPPAQSAPETSEQSAISANAGTPQANVAPVMGAAGNPGAQTATSIDTTRQETSPIFSVQDLARASPGVSFKQGNGPRDIGVSIRGSNARNGFGVRNIVVLEDGFPVTQPDGLSRTDLTDPHAYGGLDVWRGPSSALFGNYATGGALNFRTRPGGDIDGVEYGVDVGSFNYINNYVIAGSKSGNFEGSVFMSDVRGDGHFAYSDFDTQTINMLLSYDATSRDTIIFKAIRNDLYTELPLRTNLNNFLINPYQKGCERAVGAAAGCQTANFSPTGNTNSAGDRVAQTAQQAGLNRDDQRTIIGTRWEHKFDEATTSRVQVVLDDRNINQPTGNTSAVGDFFSYNVIADLSHKATFAGLPATYSAGLFWNYLPIESKTYIVAPGGNANLGPLQSVVDGATMNFGARFREEVKIADPLTATLGVTVEKTLLDGTSLSYRYSTAGAITSQTTVDADREFVNVAPEFGLLYQPNQAWQFRGRIGTGYGVPQISNLFATSTGDPGNNTGLKTQTNIGYDLGADWTPAPGVMLSLTGFYEFFENEFVSQSPAPNRSYTFNVPRSEHRGVEAAADVEVMPGLVLSGAYIYNNQIYTDYVELISGVAFDRAGNRIPGVAPHELTLRLAYDQPFGMFKGLGAFVEYQWRDGFFVDNGNLLEIPDAEVVNMNVHYKRDFDGGFMRSLTTYFEVRNVFDETYIASANNIANTTTGTAAALAGSSSGTIYAGAPRTYFGGMKIKF